MKFTDIVQDMILNGTKYRKSDFSFIKYWYFDEKNSLVAVRENGNIIECCLFSYLRENSDDYEEYEEWLSWDEAWKELNKGNKITNKEGVVIYSMPDKSDNKYFTNREWKVC